MPGPTTWVVAIAVGAAAILMWRYLRVISARQRHMLEVLQELRDSARHDAETERQVEQLLEQRHPDRAKRRHLKLMSLLAVFFAAAVAGVKAHGPGFAGAAALVAAGTLAVMTVTTTPSIRQADPPGPPIVAPRSPSLTTKLPSPGPVEPSSRPPGGGTPTTETERVLLPPTSAAVSSTTTAVPSSLPPLPTSTPPVSTSVPPLPLPKPCLLAVQLPVLPTVCLPAVHR